MKHFTFKPNYELDIPSIYEEITLSRFLKYLKLNEETKIQFEFEKILLQCKVIEALCGYTEGYLDNMNFLDLSLIANHLTDVLSNIPDFGKDNHFIINNVLYGIKHFDEMTTGEMLSYYQLMETKDKFDSIPWILAIVCRPATEVIDKETGNKEYILEDFNTKNLEYRANLLADQSFAKLMSITNFFLSGKGGLEKILKDYSNQKEVQAHN